MQLLVRLGFVAMAVFLLSRLLFFRSSRSIELPAEGAGRELKLVTLLPKDAIRAIDDPQFYPAAAADEEYGPGERVLGVEIDGDARAYPTGLLSAHEIVNDNVGGMPIAVTW